MYMLRAGPYKRNPAASLVYMYREAIVEHQHLATGQPPMYVPPPCVSEGANPPRFACRVQKLDQVGTREQSTNRRRDEKEEMHQLQKRGVGYMGDWSEMHHLDLSQHLRSSSPHS